MSDGRAARWERHREEQRRRIVDAAVTLIEQGDGSPSLIDVGRQAGLARSVVYRQFADKAALDDAIATQIIGTLRADLSAGLQLHGSLRDTVRDALEVYVAWAALHPALHVMGEDAAAQGLVRNALDSLAGQVAELFVAGFSAAGAHVTEADRRTTAPLAYGLVSGVFATVSKWIQQGAKVPSAPKLVEVIVEMVIAMTTTRLAAYGLDIDPDAPLADLLGP